jgi:hypothetical protein
VSRSEGDGLAPGALRADASAAVAQTVRDTLCTVGHERVAAEHNPCAPVAVGAREELVR